MLNSTDMSTPGHVSLFPSCPCALRDMTWIRGQDHRHVLPLGGSRPAATSADAMLGALQCFYPGWVFAVLSGHALSILLLLRYSPLAGQEQVQPITLPEHTVCLQHASTCSPHRTSITPWLTAAVLLTPKVRYRCGRS